MAGVKRIFPRASSAENSERLATEYNLASIVNRLVEEKSFIIEVTDELLKLNLGGYYIELSKQASESWPNYVGIKLEGEGAYESLTPNEYIKQGSDVGSVSDCTYSLQIMDEGKIREESFIRIKSGTHPTVIIDDGDLDN